MLLEDEILEAAGFVTLAIVEPGATCGLHTCLGHQTPEEMHEIHDAIEGAYDSGNLPS